MNCIQQSGTENGRKAWRYWVMLTCLYSDKPLLLYISQDEEGEKASLKSSGKKLVVVRHSQSVIGSGYFYGRNATWHIFQGSINIINIYDMFKKTVTGGNPLNICFCTWGFTGTRPCPLISACLWLPFTTTAMSRPQGHGVKYLPSGSWQKKFGTSDTIHSAASMQAYLPIY